ncbi:hypothetical protein [Polymorphobacter fuscus]|uniref:Uncharacterized protein n=1 Tax=Sandarakinorhabdus fusca TaxID=1439888 RepID=A0A7C9GNS7_9SPHN|nr:hypothetical protein [Polymorphobacter fuscus]KAB7647686.1 hypothetical protein F9290_06865 [Polymorphobacter fuscus]MQT16977.1 hypothetical protein [Polymorphobacter fuscus]NJC09033.1 hypothetical protein [Polymorphobacter fuscus]
MEIRKFLLSAKTITKAGEWRCGALNPKGKMHKGSFPLGKRGYILGNQWHWRVDELDCGGVPGRLLVAYRLDKVNYQAWLSIERSPGIHTVVASLEYHGDHPGWHLHSKCAAISEFDAQTSRQRNMGIRIPAVRAYHRAREYEMSHQEATNRAYRTFRIGVSEGGLFG